MKKCLFVLFSMMITMNANAVVAELGVAALVINGWHIHPSEGCALQTRFLGKDFYHFCGAQQPVCHGDWAEKKELNSTVKWYNYGETAEFNGEQYTCCGEGAKVISAPTERKGTATGTPGYWIKGDHSEVPVIKTKNVAGGTCSYTEEKDVCGKTITTEGTCETQTKKNMTCPEGQYFREASGSCAKLCAAGYAYESKTSNVCVECEETLTQGRVSDDGSTPVNEAVDSVHAICLKCNPATSILDQATRKCVPRPQLTALTMNDLLYGKDGYTKNKNVSEQCWTKYGNEYKKCVLKK
ncbi:MAG: hypothetical protein J6W40_00165 [Alphaproteobacteria bacterium]|nr:hypothetical protein [Alphaproteobacteria bacterium]